jgi:hypothetical protein
LDAYWARLALFAVSLAKQQASELWGGVAEPVRASVVALGAEFASWSSSERQAALASEFGALRNVSARLSAALEGSGPLLRAEVLRRLPSYCRGLLEEEGSTEVDATSIAPLTSILAERLVREALR